jgi:multidrug resistance efflux pump
MNHPFHRSLYYVSRAGQWAFLLRLAALAIFFVLWGAWLLSARVPNYRETTSARLEDDNSVNTIASPVSGKVVAVHSRLGEQVEAGQVLVEIDAAPQRYQLSEERARGRAIRDQFATILDEISVEQRKLEAARNSGRAMLDQAKAHERAGLISARVAAQESAQKAKLYSQGLISESEYQKAVGEAERLQAEAQALNHAIAQMTADEQVKENEIKGQIARLRSEMSRAQGAEATQSASVSRLTGEINRRLVTAPASGKLGEMQDLRAGAYIHEGERLGAIVPPGRLRAIAEFDPASALGWIKPEQRARIRLTGFPWAQYGFIPASVTGVANEVRDGKIRVELAIDPDFSPTIQLQHGLPGTVEVEVERVSPATLILRAAGKMVGSK